MGKTKKGTGESESAANTISALGADEAAADVTGDLTPKEQRFLASSARLLVGLAVRANFARASLYGYSANEHREGWRLYRTAMGENIPLDHLAPAVPDNSGDTLTVLRKLDKFENRWFPSVRKVIQRFAPTEESATRLEAAFFDKLQQQPLGPAVVGSVTLFVERVAGLDASEIPGAKKVRDVLAERGLTNDALEEVRKLLTQAATPTPTSSKDQERAESAAKSEEERRAEQRAALVSLRKWREDWRTTLEDAFDHNTKLSLGLIAAKGRKKSADGDDEDGADE
jgi:hypothetical protein